MWCLESPTGEVYSITPGRVHTVSRKTGDIILANDQSVSRKHAFLEVRTPLTEGVAVWDGPSKYGTFVNDGIQSETKLVEGFKAIITEGAKVRFGLQEMNIWTLRKERLCVCSHLLKPTEKSKVKSLLNKMGSELSDSWSKDSTHLTTNYIRPSNEVMCALASAKPIVLPEFWQHYARMVTENGACPDPANFMPPLDDNRFVPRNGCLPNMSRKTLFVDKTFVFPTTQSYDAYKSVIETAGGKALKMSDCGLSLADYCKPNFVVIGCDEPEQVSFYNKVLSTLLNKNLRIIPPDEICLALWKVSTSKQCNPSHKPNSILRRPSNVQHDTGATIVISTEDQDAPTTGIDVDDKEIPPTLTETDLMTDNSTMSMSVRATQKTSPARPTLKRTRENSSERVNGKRINVSPGKISVKKEPEEEEDMFALEEDTSRPSTSNNGSSTPFNSTNNTSNSSSSKRLKNAFQNTVTKEEKKPADDNNDGFVFLSPVKKKKKPNQRVEEEEEDLFELEKEPSPTKSNATENEEDEFDFLSSSKLSKSMKAAKRNLHDESRDMFETDDLPSCSASTSTRGEKRKGRTDTESDSPPLKKTAQACLDVTNVTKKDVTKTSAPKFSTSLAGFLNKTNHPHVKKEVKDDPDGEADLSKTFCAKVVITPLMRKPPVNASSNTSANDTTVKNFKKFKKVWSGSTTSQHVVTIRVRPTNGHTLNSTGREEEEEDEDDPFLPSRPAAPRRNGGRNHADDDDDEDNEFALPTYSQCM